ncbi:MULTISPECIES: DUF4157 domain-containing protein [Chitinophaga]|uniref:eCIS core domain-containing protein n=1 Tax=Chitinophaga TaxID=79328 RepID=UPI001CEC4765|nr:MULTISPECIES: DUF4157 domain-containing protein [Chitinophaga]
MPVRAIGLSLPAIDKRPVQRVASLSEEESAPVQQKANRTGLPDQLKQGVEQLSGYSMDDVKVHYNSDKPAAMQAHAYAQGSDIHVAPGQERHIPHEAWHVVQQKQGRVVPTMQLKGKVNVNDDTGLEQEADIMGDKAMQLKSDDMEDRSLILAGQSGMVAQRIPIKVLGDSYYPENHPTGTTVESDELSNDERRKALATLPKATADSVKDGWRAASKNEDYIVAAFDDKKFRDTGLRATASRLYKASQDTDGTLGAILEAQRSWQDFLHENGLPMEKIMSFHRSFGLENEFATWEKAPRVTKDVPSHTVVGESDAFSNLFNVKFALETDAQEELELVAPPLLAGQINGGINKAFMRAVKDKLVTFLRDFRNDNIGTKASDLPFVAGGIGQRWDWKAEAALIQIAATRKKWTTGDQVAYQLNVALKPGEIGSYLSTASNASHVPEQGQIYAKILNRFEDSNIYKGLPADRRQAVYNSLLVLSKGLANAIAIPTLTLVAKLRQPWTTGDLHSHVKDLHGIWIKDSVPNITLAALGDNVQAKADLLNIIENLKGGIDIVARDVQTGVPSYTQAETITTEKAEKERVLLRAHDKAKKSTTQLRLAAEAEAKACLVEVMRRLQLGGIQPQENASVKFLAETFGSGDGVRKDTYANIGRSATSTLHLAELRSVASTNAFLA